MACNGISLRKNSRLKSIAYWFCHSELCSTHCIHFLSAITKYYKLNSLKTREMGTSLVVQWWRTHLPMQGHTFHPGPGRFHRPGSNEGRSSWDRAPRLWEGQTPQPQRSPHTATKTQHPQKTNQLKKNKTEPWRLTVLGTGSLKSRCPHRLALSEGVPAWVPGRRGL